MTDTIDPTAPDYIAKCVAKHQRDNLVRAVLGYGYVADSSLGRLNIAGLKRLLDLIHRIEDEYRDAPGSDLRDFRKWFVLAKLRLGRTTVARSALSQLIPAPELKSVPSRDLLALMGPMMDYLTFPGLPRHVLVNITRSQLGLPTLNGSLPREWAGLSFAGMVRAYLELTTSRDVRRHAKIVIAKIIGDQELEGVPGQALVAVFSYVREYLRNPCPEPYDRIGELAFISMVRAHLGLEQNELPADIFGDHLGATLQAYLECYQPETPPSRRPVLAGLTN